MIKLTAEIALIKAVGQTLNSLSSNLSGNNISASIDEIKCSSVRVKNPFIFGRNKLGDGSTFSSGEKYFIGNQFTKSNWEFNKSYTITLSGSNIDHFTIMFDTKNNVFPTQIKVNGVTYPNDIPQFTITGLTSANTHTVVIESLNTANAQLIITGIFVGLSIELDYSQLKNLNINMYSVQDKEQPSYGIISNSGDISFLDNEYVKDYIKMKLLKENVDVEISMVDTLTKKSEKISIMKSSDINYDSYNNFVSLKLVDNLIELQDIKTESIFWNKQSQTIITAKNIYEYLYSITPSKYKIKHYENLDSNTKSVLNNIKWTYPYFESGSLWSLWDKLANVCLAKMYKLNDGTTEFICEFGV